MIPSLRIHRATLGYGTREVLREVSLTVEAGEVLAVVGPNSVGKSTLVKGASGVLPLSGGEVRIGDRDLRTMSPPERARMVAVVPQAVNLPPAFTAFEVVMMGRTPFQRWAGRETEQDHRVVHQVMERTCTEELADRLVGELSGGERQRVLVARALAQSSQVLLLDEPTAHLDLRHQDEVLKLTSSLAKEEGYAILLTLHDLNLVARHSDRVALLSDGGVRKVGLPEQVLTPAELQAVYGIAVHVTSHPLNGTPVVLYED